MSARLQEQQGSKAGGAWWSSACASRASYPHCGAGCIVKFGSSGGTQRYRCNACRRTFTALSGTPFSRLREKDKLLANARVYGRGPLGAQDRLRKIRTCLKAS